jgi:multidrug resistance efflux pump
MEALSNYNFRGFNFALWFFRILLLIVVTIVVLVFVLKINETITIREGEIVSANPQSDYKAPFDAQILNIKIKEGQQVKAGDTLIVMDNSEYKAQQANTQTEIEYLQKKITSIQVLQGAVQRKKSAIDQASDITAKKYQLDINNMVSDLKTADEQYNFQKQRLLSANEKYMGDSILYKKDMLSRYEFNTTKDANLTLKENLTNIQSQRKKQLTEKKLVYNNFTKEQNSLLLNKVQLDENAQSLIQAKNDYESQLIQAKETLGKISAELNKSYVIAAGNGMVNYLFNTEQTSNITTKGELLLSIAPQSVSYYAKVVIPEKDILHVRSGLRTQLKTDAFQNFKHAMIDGKVSYVADRKEDEKFYALIELKEAPKVQLRSGYAVYGDIIVERLPLYKYFIMKLFKRYDNQ